MKGSVSFFTIKALLLVGNTQKTFSLECSPYCYNGTNCDLDICKSCDFSCGGICSQDNTTEIQDSVSKSGVNFVNFVDETSWVFGGETTYWNSWKHSGMPYPSYGPPSFVDLNGDGLLDYFNSMHGHRIASGESYIGRMELAESVQGSSLNFPRLIPYPERINITDPLAETLDTHGQSIVDLDGDGTVDILISSGGAGAKRGTSDAPPEWTRYNFLLWGEKAFESKVGREIIRFVGGRYAAEAANVHAPGGRGRFNYIMDINGDGKLDIFPLNDRHMVDDVIPGTLLINQGNRTWKAFPGMKEYTSSMVLTDVDGDGFAHELVLNRWFCFPQREGATSFPKDVEHFCSTRPVGSTAVYKFDKSTNTIKEISPRYYNISSHPDKQPPCCPHGSKRDNDCHAKSMASGDFDNDNLADLIILYGSTMMFYFSTDRMKGELPIGKKHVGLVIKFPSYCNSAKSVQVVDLNNNGKNDILVACGEISVFLVYSQVGPKKFSLRCESNGTCLGDLTNPHIARHNKERMKELCNDIDSNNKIQTHFCGAFVKEGKIPYTGSRGLCLVDLNNDGFLDAVVSHYKGNLLFFKNKPNRNKFIAFELEGNKKDVNEYGIGATLILYAQKKTGRWKKQFREVSSHQHSSDNYGSKDSRIIFGLGRYLSPRYVRVRWPNGKITKKWTRKWKFSKKLQPIKIRIT